MIEFLKSHPKVSKIFLCENGDYYLKPVPGAKMLTRAEALKSKKASEKKVLSNSVEIEIKDESDESSLIVEEIDFKDESDVE